MAKRYNKYTVIPESVIEKYLCTEVAKMGGRAIKMNPHNDRGLPDRQCLFPGGFTLFVEVKRPGLRPRKNQERQLAGLRSMGFQATWADTTARVDEVLKWMKGYMKERRMGFHVEHICYRQECVLRRATRGKTK